MSDFTANLARMSAATKGRGLFAYLDLYRQRRALADLPPHLLADIGIAPDTAAREANRPIWDAPDHWSR